ncbi:type II toxin-antitoxin system RelE/ParE family toxin [Atlantibacter hermannii]|nr:type II toxin-antitoxin system RelE/ParE family toxin [Atlantibacter hermannii]MDU7391896.1 type II toxin-antitoxin system RelE/ParE family toxin [Atlantibacter hermannii]
MNLSIPWSGPGPSMKESELTPKAEEDLEAIWNYSLRLLV